MTASPHQPTEPLARLVREKRKLLEQLAVLGRRQGELIASGEVTSLVSLLSGKQQLIAGLQVVERGLDAFRDEDPDTRVWPSAEQRAACQADADACNRLLAEVLATEQAHEQQMTERRDAIGTQLQQARSAHAASTAYKPHLRRDARPNATAPPLDTPLSESINASLDLTAGG